MNGIITIPKGNNILDFLHELDGGQEQTKNAWIFMHNMLIRELSCQCRCNVSQQILPTSGSDITFALRYGASEHYIGAIAFRAEPCYDSAHYPVWGLMTDLFLDENSPVKIAFRHLSIVPSKALFLTLES